MSDDKPKERLNDKEFLQLLPTLPTEELFMIEIQKDDAWMDLFKPEFKTITCNVCSFIAISMTFTSHCRTNRHKNNLQEVKRFYHPKYTHPKNGDAQDESAQKLMEQKYAQAKTIAQNINDSAQSCNSRRYEKRIRTLALKTEPKDLKHVFVDVGLPLTALIQLEFSIKEGEWQPMLTTDRLHPNSRFFCVLCSKYCAGIITVGAHFGGNSHMALQIASRGVRHPGHRLLTKNVRYCFKSTFDLTVSERGKQFYKARALKFCNDTEKLDDKSNENEDDEHSDDDIQLVESLDSGAGSDNAKTNLTETVNSKALAIAEKILERSEKVQKTIAADKPKLEVEEGLIGVEYVVKLLRPNDETPKYECVLCEFLLSENNMQGHLISHDHRLKYCDMHYSDTMSKYKSLIGHMKYHEFFGVMGPILSKLATAIERTHSRAVPAALQESVFMEKRGEYVAAIYGYRHASQSHGPSFTKVISNADVQQFKKNRHNYKQPVAKGCRFITIPKNAYIGIFSYSHVDRLSRALTQKSPLEGPQFTERERRKSVRNRSPSPAKIRPVAHKSSKTREHVLEKTDADSRSVTSSVWKLYNKEVSVEKEKIEKSYANYRKQPENHPLYEQEWNRFWKQRKDELIAEGIDHRTYNYQAEWVHYFRNRLEELFCEAVRQMKIDVRKHLNISLDADESALQNDAKNQGMPVMPTDGIPPYKMQRLNTDGVVPIWSAQTLPHQPIMATETAVPTQAVQYELPLSDDKPNVIHVLRLMTAVEDHLGSLGGKIMDLFSKSLQLEKKCSDNAQLLERCILTPENCNLLEVAMEKLKGVLFAGLLEGNKTRSFNKVIKYTEEILTYADSRGWRNNCADNVVPETQTQTDNDLQKLIDAIQNKNVAPVLQQKSLSDTLKELMAGKSKEKDLPAESNTNASMSNSRDYISTNQNDYRRSNVYVYEQFDKGGNKPTYASQGHLNESSFRNTANSSQLNAIDMNFRNPTNPSQLKPNELNTRNQLNSSAQLNTNDMNLRTFSSFSSTQQTFRNAAGNLNNPSSGGAFNRSNFNDFGTLARNGDTNMPGMSGHNYGNNNNNNMTNSNTARPQGNNFYPGSYNRSFNSGSFGSRN